MGKLYDVRMKIEQITKDRNLDPFKTKGELTLRCGFMISLIKESTPDDEEKLKKLKNAVREVFKIDI